MIGANLTVLFTKSNKPLAECHCLSVLPILFVWLGSFDAPVLLHGRNHRTIIPIRQRCRLASASRNGGIDSTVPGPWGRLPRRAGGG